LKNSISFRVWGKYALFTDPITKVGGEKSSYPIPTYEALKGVAKSIYWKPTLIWVIDRVRVLNPIRTQSKGVKPLKYQTAGNDLSIYTFLSDVAYQVEAHFVWNTFRPELSHDRVDGKHFAMAQRALDKGGRQDIFLGTRDCQGYVEPCAFGEDDGAYDHTPELSFGPMFHGFDYPDETGGDEMVTRFWLPEMNAGVIDFVTPEDCLLRRSVRKMKPKIFTPGQNYTDLSDEMLEDQA